MKPKWYSFTSNYMETVKPGHFHVQTVSVLTRSPLYGMKVAMRRVPPGFKIWTWFEGLPRVPDISCNSCGAPWHDASGHIDEDRGEVWCGACARDMLKFLKGMLARRWGGVKFYEHAGPLPANPPAGWEP